jgi:hypothetical protein
VQRATTSLIDPVSGEWNERSASSKNCETAPMDDRALAELRDLARRDAELAGAATELRRRDLAATQLRTRAEAIESFFLTYPDEAAERNEALAAASAELARRRAELEAADAARAHARDEDARIHAQNGVERARDHIVVAEATLRRAEGDVAALEREAAALPIELVELERESGVTGARALVDWAAHRHAELFVASGQTDAARERVIREAHELASMLLGEPTYGATVAQALDRVERHCASLPGQVSESR